MESAAYIVRPGPNEELRMSLRSAHVNAGVENVWIVGDPPEWYTGPRIDGNRFPDKWRNVFDNVRIIAEHPDLPPEVAVWNDDFFALAPATIEMTYRGPLKDQIEKLVSLGRSGSLWTHSIIQTRAHLKRQLVDNPVSYELHRPFPIVREHMAKILKDASRVAPHNPPQWRTLYGNLAPHEGGRLVVDRKVTRPTATPGEGDDPWVSTDDKAYYRGVRAYIDHLFPEPSPWERV